MSLSYLVFVIEHILPDRSRWFSFNFSVHCTSTIIHFVVLFGHRHKLYPVRLVMVIQFLFRSRVESYDRSHRSLVSSLLEIAHYSIGLNNSALYSTEITLIHSITLLSYLLFMMGHILSNFFWKFSSNFDENDTCMISHIVVLFSLSHKLYPINSVITV